MAGAAVVPGTDSRDSPRMGPRLRHVLLKREERKQRRPARAEQGGTRAARSSGRAYGFRGRICIPLWEAPRSRTVR